MNTISIVALSLITTICTSLVFLYVMKTVWQPILDMLKVFG